MVIIEATQEVQEYAIEALQEVTEYAIETFEEVTEVFIYGEDVGIPGEPGMNNYQLAVKNGFKGTEDEYLESLKPNLSQELGDYKKDLLTDYLLAKL